MLLLFFGVVWLEPAVGPERVWEWVEVSWVAVEDIGRDVDSGAFFDQAKRKRKE